MIDTVPSPSPPPPAVSGMTPLVELVDLAARHGWQIAATLDGELEWTRGANRVVARFAKSTQRPRYCGLFSYHSDRPAADFTDGQLPLGPVVWRGVGNGGDRDEAAASLRRWFTQRERALTDPTQW